MITTQILTVNKEIRAIKFYISMLYVPCIENPSTYIYRMKALCEAYGLLDEAEERLNELRGFLLAA